MQNKYVFKKMIYPAPEIIIIILVQVSLCNDETMNDFISLVIYIHSFCRSTGICDDLLFLLDEELTNIQLCALHMEMRNTEQLLASVGLLAYKVGSLLEVFPRGSHCSKEEVGSGVCRFKTEYPCELHVR